MNRRRRLVAFLLPALLLLCAFRAISVAQDDIPGDVDRAVRLYESGDYQQADNVITRALRKDKRDVAALTWYALIKMENAKLKFGANTKACKAVVDKLVGYLNTYYGVDLLFLDDDRLYSFYHSAYAKAYWLNYNRKEVGWFIDKSLEIYPKNYEALDAKGRMLLYRSENPNSSERGETERNLAAAYAAFLAEADAAGAGAPEIRARGLYWAGYTLGKMDRKDPGKIRELLEAAAESNPAGIYAERARKMLDKTAPQGELP
jgi:hypothetical protein